MKVNKSKLIMYGLVVLLLLIGIWAVRYYNEDMVMFDNKEYRETPTNGDYLLYTSFYGPEIKLFVTDDMRVLSIEDKQYSVRPHMQTETRKSYIVNYPDGQSFIVDDMYDNNELMVVMDDNFDIVDLNNENSKSEEVMSQEQLSYYPTSIVTLAYEEYHVKQGNWLVFMIAIAVFMFGLLLNRNRKLQMFFFYISHGLDVVDPEPSEFYFTTTKIGGAVVMILSGILFFMSL